MGLSRELGSERLSSRRSAAGKPHRPGSFESGTAGLRRAGEWSPAAVNGRRPARADVRVSGELAATPSRTGALGSDLRHSRAASDSLERIQKSRMKQIEEADP